MPISDVTPGMTTHGLTVTSGKTPLATALRKGLRITVTSSTPGALVARAYVDKKTARRLKINKQAKGPVAVAAAAKAIGEGRSRVTLKFTRRARKRLNHAKRVKLTLRAAVTDVDGNRGTDRAKLVLKRRV
jgi:aromatic ring hydroxylase